MAARASGSLVLGGDPEPWLRLEGDTGGVLYVACPMSQVLCSEEVLRALHEDLERLCGDAPAGRRFHRDAEPPTENAFIIRRMVLCDKVRITELLVKAGVSDRIVEVLAGRRERFASPEEWDLVKARVDAVRG